MTKKQRLGDAEIGKTLLKGLSEPLSQEASESIQLMLMFTKNRFASTPQGEPAQLREYEHYRYMSAIPQLIDWVANLKLEEMKRIADASEQSQMRVLNHLCGSVAIPGVPAGPTPTYEMKGLPDGANNSSDRMVSYLKTFATRGHAAALGML